MHRAKREACDSHTTGVVHTCGDGGRGRTPHKHNDREQIESKGNTGVCLVTAKLIMVCA